MAKASPIISALNAGEWTKLLDGRTDIQGYPASSSVLENFIPSIQGPIIRRAGSRFVRTTKLGGASKVRLIPFVKSRNDALQLEFGDGYVRFYQGTFPVVSGTAQTITGVTLADPVVITSVGHGYSNGDEVLVRNVTGTFQLNNRWFIVSNATANTYELTTIHGEDVDGTDYTAYVSGGETDTPYEISSPYTAAQLEDSFGLDFVQSGDVLFITDRAGALEPRTLSRFGTVNWQFDTFDPDGGPWLPINATSTDIYSSAATGTVTLTASSSIFSAGDVGSLIRLDQENITATNVWETGTAYTAGDYVRSEGKEYVAATSGTSGTSIPAHTTGTVTDGGVEWTYTSSGYGIARITAQGGTTATATVLTRFPQTVIGSGNATTLWRKGAWSDANGYPTNVTFFRERLCFGGGQTVWMSVVGDFYNFAIDDFGEVLTESAITVDVQSSEANKIVGLTEGSALIVNTIGTEFTIDAQTTTTPLGPNNLRVIKQTSYGAAPIRPIRVGESVLFLQASQRKMRSMQFEFQVDNYVAPDVTVRAAEILGRGIVQMTRQEEPYQTIWGAREDGQLLSFAFDQNQQVRAWARHLLGGNGVVESVSSIPSDDGARDQVWVVVKRTINGGTRRYIEYLQAELGALDEQEDAMYADSMRTYDSVPTTTFYGFDHLEGETVGVLADGASIADKVVSNGRVIITEGAASVAQIGYRYKSIYQSNRIDAGAQDGTSQAKTKRITDCAWRVINSLGGEAGPSSDKLDEIRDLNYRQPATPMGSPPPLFTGDALLPWPGGYETDGYLRFETDAMYPVIIAAVLPQVVTQEAR
jgi:hypothetical protein